MAQAVRRIRPGHRGGPGGRQSRRPLRLGVRNGGVREGRGARGSGGAGGAIGRRRPDGGRGGGPVAGCRGRHLAGCRGGQRARCRVRRSVGKAARRGGPRPVGAADRAGAAAYLSGAAGSRAARPRRSPSRRRGTGPGALRVPAARAARRRPADGGRTGRRGRRRRTARGSRRAPAAGRPCGGPAAHLRRRAHGAARHRPVRARPPRPGHGAGRRHLRDVHPARRVGARGLRPVPGRAAPRRAADGTLRQRGRRPGPGGRRGRVPGCGRGVHGVGGRLPLDRRGRRTQPRPALRRHKGGPPRRPQVRAAPAHRPGLRQAAGPRRRTRRRTGRVHREPAVPAAVRGPRLPHPGLLRHRRRRSLPAWTAAGTTSNPRCRHRPRSAASPWSASAPRPRAGPTATG